MLMFDPKIHPRKLTCPPKNGGWKATFLLNWPLFRFGRCRVLKLLVPKILTQITKQKASKSSMEQGKFHCQRVNESSFGSGVPGLSREAVGCQPFAGEQTSVFEDLTRERIFQIFSASLDMINFSHSVASTCWGTCIIMDCKHHIHIIIIIIIIITICLR